MPTLNWIGRKAVENHQRQVKFYLLNDEPALSCGAPGSGNLIINADNLLGLKAILPAYAGRVKCIYIDPPYNTGNEGWAYNDNVSDPIIQTWLGQVVGKEGETLDRHERWLCMLYPRLILLKEFLRKDGVIFVSIDDNELGNLQAIMREVFGGSNEVATIVWEKGKKGDSKLVAVSHEYIVAFARDKAFLREKGIKWRRKKPGADEVLQKYEEIKAKHTPKEDEARRPKMDQYESHNVAIRKEMMAWFKSLKKGDPRKDHKHYSWSDSRGLYFPDNFHGPDDGRESRPRYPIKHPETGLDCAIPSTGWRWEEETTTKALAEDPPRVHFGKDHTTIPNRKSYLAEIDEEPMQSVFYTDGRAATLQVESILGKGAFQFPKDADVIADLINMVTDPGDIVLDSFGGSGTTAHAVQILNKTHNANLKFILIELDENVAREKTRLRVQRVIEGYTPLAGKKKTPIEGLGGGFRFCKLGAPLFDEQGRINEPVTFDQLARHVYFSETKESLPQTEAVTSPLIGVTPSGVGIYLLAKGILGEKTGDILSGATLQMLPKHDGPRVVYAAGCRLSPERRTREDITFKQTPYSIRDR